MDARPVNQHWVPQFYLRHFATLESRVSGSERVWLWDLAEGKPVPGPTAVKNVCGQRYLYSPEGKDGEREWSLDEQLERLETTAGSLWSGLLTGETRTSDPAVREVVAMFVATLHLRNVTLLKTLACAMDLIGKLYPPSPEFLASRTEDDPDPTHAGRHFVHMLRRDGPRIAAGIAAKRWAILRMRSDVFVTSDRPVTFTSGGKLSGPGRPETSIYFPLSPRHMLFMDDNITHPGDVVLDWGDRGPLPVANALAHAHALRFLISHQPLAEFSEQDRPAGWNPSAPRPPRAPPRAPRPVEGRR